jgi:hypothetical protein
MPATGPHLRHENSAPRPMAGALSAQLREQQAVGAEPLTRGQLWSTRTPQTRASDAISIARWRHLLGEDADGLSDQDIVQIRQHAEAMAHIIVEMLVQKGATPE